MPPLFQYNLVSRIFWKNQIRICLPDFYYSFSGSKCMHKASKKVDGKQAILKMQEPDQVKIEVILVNFSEQLFHGYYIYF